LKSFYKIVPFFVTSIIISLNAGVIDLVVIVNFKPCHFLADEKEDSLPLD